ncbi:hypothetical protein HAX54_011065, partial [Datura stramonium]|nr:hypothetical protein [Datura stramonium]
CVRRDPRTFPWLWVSQRFNRLLFSQELIVREGFVFCCIAFGLAAMPSESVRSPGLTTSCRSCLPRWAKALLVRGTIAGGGISVAVDRSSGRSFRRENWGGLLPLTANRYSGQVTLPVKRPNPVA